MKAAFLAPAPWVLPPALPALLPDDLVAVRFEAGFLSAAPLCLPELLAVLPAAPALRPAAPAALPCEPAATFLAAPALLPDDLVAGRFEAGFLSAAPPVLPELPAALPAAPALRPAAPAAWPCEPAATFLAAPALLPDDLVAGRFEAGFLSAAPPVLPELPALLTRTLLRGGMSSPHQRVSAFDASHAQHWHEFKNICIPIGFLR